MCLLGVASTTAARNKIKPVTLDAAFSVESITMEKIILMIERKLRNEYKPQKGSEYKPQKGSKFRPWYHPHGHKKPGGDNPLPDPPLQ